MEFAPNTIIGLEIFWWSAAALSIRKFGSMHRSVGKRMRDAGFGGVYAGRLVQISC